ncbi:hypothetical protein Scep_027939 [Stephania cephalantha]|uniref:Uncharacterized protein n=1 Tax=Stephania cephalantha TaxID=152367 RepID=A0AAP0HLA4_9MAGN
MIEAMHLIFNWQANVLDWFIHGTSCEGSIAVRKLFEEMPQCHNGSWFAIVSKHSMDGRALLVVVPFVLPLDLIELKRWSKGLLQIFFNKYGHGTITLSLKLRHYIYLLCAPKFFQTRYSLIAHSLCLLVGGLTLGATIRDLSFCVEIHKCHLLNEFDFGVSFKPLLFDMCVLYGCLEIALKMSVRIILHKMVVHWFVCGQLVTLNTRQWADAYYARGNIMMVLVILYTLIDFCFVYGDSDQAMIYIGPIHKAMLSVFEVIALLMRYSTCYLCGWGSLGEPNVCDTISRSPFDDQLNLFVGCSLEVIGSSFVFSFYPPICRAGVHGLLFDFDSVTLVLPCLYLKEFDAHYRSWHKPLLWKQFLH